MNAPQTLEGASVWELAMLLGGQLRVSSSSVLGWDMTAALAMARAVGIPECIAACLLPEIEERMVAKINEQLKAGGRVNGE